jgi:DnaK suppressor protein
MIYTIGTRKVSRTMKTSHSPLKKTKPLASSLHREFEQHARRLERAIQRQQELIRLPGATRGEWLDEAAEMTEQASNIAILEQLTRELDQVRAAQQRLREGRYGICKDCGRAIPAARLRALPYATLCVRCQTLRGPRAENQHDAHATPRA